MIYAFLGSTLLGCLSTALLLWRKSVVEKKLAESQAERERAVDTANRCLDELNARTNIMNDQLKREQDLVKTIRKQRDEALDKLAKASVPGSIGSLLRDKNTKTT